MLPVHSSRRTRRAQRAKTGAAFVEALIVIGFIIVAMQCIWWMFQYTLFQHRAHVEARQKAWESALKGCGGADVQGPLNGLSKSPGNPKDVGGLQADSETAPSWFGLSPGSTATVSLNLPQEIFGKSVVASEEAFACNEKGGNTELEFGSGGGPDTDQAISDATQ